MSLKTPNTMPGFIICGRKCMRDKSTDVDQANLYSSLHRLKELTHRIRKQTPIKMCVGGFPGGAVVKNPPANAGDTGSSPGPGRSHMPQSNSARAPQLLSLRSTARALQLLSPRITTTEPTRHNYQSPCAQNLCSAAREATAMRSPHTVTKSSPHSPQLEKARAQQQRPSAVKNK